MVPPGPPVGEETIFDLGSLTKPLVTALAIMRLVDRKRLSLDQTLSEILPPGSRLGNKADLTLRLLLCHSAGLPDWRPYYQLLEETPLSERKQQVRSWILEEPPVHLPGSRTVYSDLGFMLLEWIVEEALGLDMADYVESVFYEPLGLKRTFLFRRGETARYLPEAFAATEICPWRGRRLCGEVHDENAFALGGYSGHAGLFSTAGEVYALARLLMDHAVGLRSDLLEPATVRLFFERQDRFPRCGRALGWDMPAAVGSAAGRYFSPGSVGHLGFPGTSLWMDLEKDVQVVFLTNRIHPSRENQAIQQFRPRIHDRIMREIL